MHLGAELPLFCHFPCLPQASEETILPLDQAANSQSGALDGEVLVNPHEKIF